MLFPSIHRQDTESSPLNTPQVPGLPSGAKHRSRSVIKSASALGLSLLVSSGKSFRSSSIVFVVA